MSQILAVQSTPVVRAVAPSGPNATSVIQTWPPSETAAERHENPSGAASQPGGSRISSPVRASQMRAVASCAPVRSRSPSGLKSTAVTGAAMSWSGGSKSPWPSITTGRPRSHSRTSASAPAVATVRPSGLNAAELTVSV